ncbi:MAG: hypothetical protein MUF25_24670, partial [Pirellulaceae bacterium]|nr:hypothetical protein [Pirellulaceae bacterium]
QGAFKTVQKQMQDLAEKKAAAAPPGLRHGRRGGSPSFTNANWTAEEEKRLTELRAQMTTFYIRQTSAPSLVETVTLEVTLARNAEPGRRELRLQTAQGLTNPLVFEVGQFPEYTEPSGRSLAVAASQDGTRRRRPPEGTPKPLAGTIPIKDAADSPTTIVLPTTLNGQILPGDVDRYRFQARTGQQLVVDVAARSLIPYLSDAVPGWFQAAVTLFDATGNEVAYDDGFRFHPDPVLHCEIPNDGQYVLEVKDALFRGREDFVYRVAIGELPHVTGIFPLGGRAGGETTVELDGWNLPVTRLTDTPQAPGLRSIFVYQGEFLSNRVPFAADTLPESQEDEPNNEPDTAQRVALPVIVNGRIDCPGDLDVFCFEGHAGQQVVAEVKARRLDSSLDSALKLTNANGGQVAFNDDFEDKAAGLTTHHADSRLIATLPSPGLYCLYLVDEQRKGGKDYSYRLHIDAPQPDFELRVVPSSVNARAGTSVPITVHALRRDGFDGDIQLALQDAPPGFRLSGACVPAGQEMVRLTLTVPAESQGEPSPLSLFGQATIQGKAVTHAAVAADDLMQAFIYRHLVPASKLEVCITGSPHRFTVGGIAAESIKIPRGGKVRVPVTVPASTFLGDVHLELSDPPAGITIEDVSLGRLEGEIAFRSDATVVTPGLKGNLIVNAFAMRANDGSGKGRAQRIKPRILLSALPAVPFEIVAE